MTECEGKCVLCGKVHYSNRKGDIIVCDCWKHCPMCSAEMLPYSPDLACNTYGADAKRDLQILVICTNHTPPFYSTQKPAEVVCT